MLCSDIREKRLQIGGIRCNLFVYLRSQIRYRQFQTRVLAELIGSSTMSGIREHYKGNLIIVVFRENVLE